MRSPAELRRGLERGLRLGAYAALALALVAAIRASTIPARTIQVSPAGLDALLRGRIASRDTVALRADTALDAVHRDWLAALRSTGTAVRWDDGGAIPALAIGAEPLADPTGGTQVLVAAPANSRVRLADEAGSLDSTTAAGAGASFTVSRVAGRALVAVGNNSASAAAADSLVIRPVVVLGQPGWETKFVIAALEERGWVVEARIPLSPEAAVIQGDPGRLDTARVGAVIALDEAAIPEARRIEAYVRAGGGLVLGADAAGSSAFAALRAGIPGKRQQPEMLEIGAGSPRSALASYAIAAGPESVPLERQQGSVVLAGRRVGLGRVIQSGYQDTWRWRMAGADGAPEAHRRWWASLVSSVAYRATLPAAPVVQRKDAPRAQMVAALGPRDSTLREAARTPDRPPGSSGWLLVLALVALLAEWTSRRLRGLA